MPNEKQHRLQYQRNKETIIFLLSSPNPYYEWVVTVAFYTALHLVDLVITKKLGFDPIHSHSDRDKYLEKLSCLKEIRQEYKSLQLDSKQARYYCVPFNKVKAEKSLDKLAKIEKFIFDMLDNETIS